MERCSKRALPRSAAAPLAALFLACSAGGPPEPRGPALVDPGATAETRALFVNLRRLAGKAVLFGHQDDLAYGVHWFNQPGRSDVKETAGSYPAVYGWDVGGLEGDAGASLDAVAFARQRGWITEGYRRRGVVTLSWHMRNPVTGGTAWDTTQAVVAILPGGAQHEHYTRWLDRFAEYVTSLRAPGREDGAGDLPAVPRDEWRLVLVGGAARDGGRVPAAVALHGRVPARPAGGAQRPLGLFDRRVRLEGGLPGALSRRRVRRRARVR